jgi:hypothetical protein
MSETESPGTTSPLKNDIGIFFFEIEKLEHRLKTDNHNIAFLEQLCDLCVKADKRDKAHEYAMQGLDAFEKNPSSGFTNF